MDFTALVAAQRQYFNSGTTRSVSIRRLMLDKLERAIVAHEGKILAALEADLGKSGYEAYASEVGIVLSELRFAKNHVENWATPHKRRNALALFPAKSRVLAEPYGVALILSPWNYPFQLTLVPLISALAAGCTAVVKPSAYAPNTAAVIEEIISGLFDPRFVAVVQGGRAENAALLEEHFDYIFFTGSTEVGKVVMTAAAKHLTPVTLELGGKSPVIIRPDANLALTARRLVWGKFINAGQTCVAPDHVYVPSEMRDALVAELGRQIVKMYGTEPIKSPDLPKIINEKHFDRLNALMDSGTVALGGQSHRERCRIAPTVLVDVTEESAIMAEEIFGPILPILTYTDLDELLASQQCKPKPLALYIFAKNKGDQEYIVEKIPSGGVCVNDVVMHLVSPYVPFGGVGESGMGYCHGKAGYDTFTHYRTVVNRGKLDLPMRYPPFRGKKLGLLKKLM